MKKTLLLFAVIASMMLKAEVIYVSTSGLDTNDGLTAGTAVKSFVKAISLVTGNTTEIILAPGTYTETAIADLKVACPNLTIRGENAKTTTIQTTSTTARILKNSLAHLTSNNNLTIQDLTFKGGSLVAGSGGAIAYSQTAGYTNNLTIERVVFDGNSTRNSATYGTSNGGALFFAGNNLTVNNCYFKNNKATGSTEYPNTTGGAIYLVPVVGAGTPTVYDQGLFVTITNTTFDGNEASQKGGAVELYNNYTKASGAPNSYLKFINCTFLNNKVLINPTANAEANLVVGSAIDATTQAIATSFFYDFTIANCTFTNNIGGSNSAAGGPGTAPWESKATVNFNGSNWVTATLVNNIFNTTATANCGAAIMGNFATGGTKYFGTNNIVESVWTTRITDAVFNADAVANNNLIGANATNLNSTLTDNSTASVFAVPYLELTTGSNAINAGVNSFGTPNIVPDKDTRGAGIATTNKDCGAYEFNGITTTGPNPKRLSLSIYPNPVISTLYIESDDVQSIAVYALSGTKLLSTSNINRSVNVDGLKSGMYLIKIKTTDNTYIQSFIKK